MAQQSNQPRTLVKVLLDDDIFLVGGERRPFEGFQPLSFNSVHPQAAYLRSLPVPILVASETIAQVRDQLSDVEAWRLNDICHAVERYYKLGCVVKSLAYSDDVSDRKPFGTFYVILRPDRHLTEDFLTRMIGQQAYNALLLGPVDQSVQNRIAEIRRIRLETEYAAAVAAALSEGRLPPPRPVELLHPPPTGNQVERPRRPRPPRGTMTRGSRGPSAVPGRGAELGYSSQVSGYGRGYQGPNPTAAPFVPANRGGYGQEYPPLAPTSVQLGLPTGGPWGRGVAASGPGDQPSAGYTYTSAQIRLQTGQTGGAGGRHGYPGFPGYVGSGALPAGRGGPANDPAEFWEQETLTGQSPEAGSDTTERPSSTWREQRRR